MEKACTKCLKSFPVEYFHLKGEGRRNSRCPKCCYEWVKANSTHLNAYKKRRYWSNIEESRARNLRNAKAYYRRNAEEIKELARQRHAANKERNNKMSREYYAAHKEDILKGNKIWRDKNPQRIKELSKQYKKDHPEETRVANQKRRSRIAGATGECTIAQWRKLKDAYHHTCPSCLRSEPRIILTVDHIIPITRKGNNDIDNIQPLCKGCNSSKGAKIIKYPIPTMANLYPADEGAPERAP